jgi:chemotaxis protein methyltransferase WspC
MMMKKRLEIDSTLLHEVVERLGAAAGIDPDSLDLSRIRWTIELRCRHLHLPTAHQYLERLRSSLDGQEELDELIDALVIQETRFFRDTAVFEQIRHWAVKAQAAAQRPLRILSAPCSTGQEAYSLAAVLRLAGIPTDDFRIDAFDISRAALATAARGVYADGALQTVPAELQTACGVLRDHHWHMHEPLRRTIRFERRNLAVEGALDTDAKYHLILCRNLFIYLNAEARAMLAESLSRALLPGGLLIVGAGDRIAEVNARFVPVKPAAGFGFVHRTHAVARSATRRARVPAASVRATRVQAAEPVAEDGVPDSPAIRFYRRAVEYKERGNLRQAERRCRQALYLAPGYLPALELLQCLWQVHPNARLRRALSARILRVRGDMEALAGLTPLGEEAR